MASDADKPSSLMMVSNIGGTTLVMAGVVFVIASADLMPGSLLLLAGVAVLLLAKRLRPKGAPSASSGS